MSSALIELKDYKLETNIGTYGPSDIRPSAHILNLKLGIKIDRVVIAHDGMANVFDYDKLIEEINLIAADGHYETQERLVTLIAGACAAHLAVQCIEISLRKSPVQASGGSIGVLLRLNEIDTSALRSGP